MDDLVFTTELTLKPGERQTLRTPKRDVLFRPTALVIVTPDPFAISVEAIFVGQESCMAGRMSAAPFAEGQDHGFCFPTIAAGIEATLEVRNETDKPRTLSAKFVGHAVDVRAVGAN